MYSVAEKLKQYLIIFLFPILIFSCAKPEPTDLTKVSMIPVPVSVSATGSTHTITNETVIYISESNDETKNVSAYLSNFLHTATGFDFIIEVVDTEPAAGIYLALIPESVDKAEGYELEVTEDIIKLSARQPEGLFRGIQTLRQLLPAKIEAQSVQDQQWTVATGKIVDYPEYEYRGSMLDVSRHFFSKEDVKRYIDLIAAYKMNRLHLHLADDQGWRIEIKSWPNLTAHGGKTEVGGGDGGFYTQEDYKEIVQYAAERYIMIIPEIDMPGHTNAALSSYPELNCSGEAPELYTGTEVGFSTLCTDKEITYQFVDDVIGELAVLTPGPYIHIGGDESHVTPMEDYIPFINRVQEIVLSHNKRMIGWDEVANAELDSSSIIQYWSEADNIIMGLSQGAKVIMSPAYKAYLDMQYDSATRLGQNWAAYIEVDEGYQWDPAELNEQIKRANIIGVEAPLWTETMETIDDLEYMMFPRIMGYAEIGWSPKVLRKWDTYKARLAAQAERLKLMQVDYYASKKVQWVTE
ncbi:beta-N-acetylhexosaminidase [Fulvivirga lutimaris]|uniref:beta-N-acetylhexosaminidase n=1 Tax=Fulvivirga lutimaris TaxID=1819566 RepID=UPI0012BC4029|nr:beta-N-acetylhexosaminidase [Fulvivirga lutimaris]MTI41960.1 beta-N-acetylhexosaminidase [Fulvivirga lutimaris]